MDGYTVKTTIQNTVTIPVTRLQQINHLRPQLPRQLLQQHCPTLQCSEIMCNYTEHMVVTCGTLRIYTTHVLHIIFIHHFRCKYKWHVQYSRFTCSYTYHTQDEHLTILCKQRRKYSRTFSYGQIWKQMIWCKRGVTAHNGKCNEHKRNMSANF